MAQKPKRQEVLSKSYAGYRYYPYLVALFIILSVIGYMNLAVIATLTFTSLASKAEAQYSLVASGDCTAGLFYNPQVEEEVIFSIDCTKAHIGEYTIQQIGWEYMAFDGEMEQVFHGVGNDYYEGEIFHVLDHIAVRPDTKNVRLLFSSTDGERLDVNLDIHQE